MASPYTGRNVSIMRRQARVGGLAGNRGLGLTPAGRRGLAFVATAKFRGGIPGVSVLGQPQPVARYFRGAEGAFPHVTMDLVAGPLIAELTRLAQVGTPALMARTVVAVGMKLLGKIAYKTPIDSGLARATWAVLQGLVGALSVPRGRGLDRGERVRAGRQEGEAAGHVELRSDVIGRNPYVEIQNNLPYIIPLEYGWSGQAPLGMVRLSVAEMSGRTGPEIAALFRAEWLEDMYRVGRELRAFRRTVNLGPGAGRTRIAGVTV